MELRKSIWAVVAAVLASGCGSAGTVVPEPQAGNQQGRIANAAHRYSVTLPAGWRRARRNLTPQLAEPREILSVATYPLRYAPRARCRIPGCPTPALNGFRATDVLVSIQERVHTRQAPEDVPIDLHRQRWEPGPEPAGCVRARVAWYAFDAFAEAGRSFYVVVVVGKHAPAKTRVALGRVLESLRFSAAHEARADLASPPAPG